MPDPLAFIDDELRDLEARGLRRQTRTISGPQGPQVTVEGRTLRLFCSNDYLGLANHPAVVGAAKEALNRYGFGTGASRLVSGTMAAHAEVEAQLARFLGTEAALAYPSGYAANLGVIPALVGPGDAVILDRLNHASLVDGARLSGAKLLVYPHRDASRLAEILERRTRFRRRLIVTDGIFSVDGDLAPLPEIFDLSRRHGAILMVDDAHGAGVLGAQGRGVLEHFGLDRVDILMGSLSKALGGSGGYIAGSRRLIDLLLHRSRAFIYTTALPPDACAAAAGPHKMVASQPELRERLRRNVARVREGLLALGFDLMGSETQITPIRIGDAKKTVAISDFLYEQGIFLSAIRPPTVSDGQSRLRLTVTASHDEADIAHLLDAMRDARKRFF
jgi:glycine C-acetyltransferase